MLARALCESVLYTEKAGGPMESASAFKHNYESNYRVKLPSAAIIKTVFDRLADQGTISRLKVMPPRQKMSLFYCTRAQKQALDKIRR